MRSRVFGLGVVFVAVPGLVVSVVVDSLGPVGLGGVVVAAVAGVASCVFRRANRFLRSWHKSVILRSLVSSFGVGVGVGAGSVVGGVVVTAFLVGLAKVCVLAAAAAVVGFSVASALVSPKYFAVSLPWWSS